MIEGKRILAVITARGASKGVPRKNIRVVAGKLLIAWTIESAKRSRYLDRVILSSEDTEIIAVAKKWGCDVPFIRPAALAQDETPGIDPVIDALNSLPEKYDFVVLLQPTSPLRTTEDLDRSIELCLKKNAPACVSVTEPEKSPYWMYTLNAEGRMHPLLENPDDYRRRQDLPRVYALNGAVFVADCHWLVRTQSFVTPETIAYEMLEGSSTRYRYGDRPTIL